MIRLPESSGYTTLEETAALVALILRMHREPVSWGFDGRRLVAAPGDDARAVERSYWAVLDVEVRETADRLAGGFSVNFSDDGGRAHTVHGNAVATEALRDMLRKLAEHAAQVTMGVGDGGGRLFVHGDYDSIKACQAKLDRLAELERGLSEVQGQLGRAAFALREMSERLERLAR